MPIFKIRDRGSDCISLWLYVYWLTDLNVLEYIGFNWKRVSKVEINDSSGE